MNMQVKLLQPKKIKVLEIFIYLIYVVYFLILRYVRDITVSRFFAQSQELQVLDYSQDELDFAKQFSQILEPIPLTPSNIVYRWNDTDFYDGIKLLLLFPVAVHLIYLLFVHWSDSFRAKAIFKETQDPDQAYFMQIRIFTDSTASRVILTPVKHQIYQRQNMQQVEFEGEKYKITKKDNQILLKHLYDGYDLSQLDLKSTGLSSVQHYQSLVSYGENRIILNYPNYLHILKDSILSPYFAFQIFTSVLYAVDNFATYSIFSISMLIFVEGANVFQKFNSLKQTVKLAPQPVQVCVRRDNVEQYVSSISLVPGDTIIFKKQDYSSSVDVAVKQQKKNTTYNPMHQIAGIKVMQRFKEILFGKYYDESICKHLNKLKFVNIFPVDMIVTKGQLIADESILTGEQTSQIKEAIDDEQLNDISLISPYNQLFGGTYLIQIQSDIVEAIVIKTAGQTEQGTLIKTIAFNEERMNVTTKDSLLFLFIMFIVACFSAVYCFIRGYNSKIATISKLSLETLMVLVNVIPPDLPTELSMCISNSISSIRKKKIFSTEPYRILNAGRLSYVCFDKSGTLTQSDIKILGVDEKLTEKNVQFIVEKTQHTQQNFQPSELSAVTLSACQSINVVNGKFFGDILEVNSFKAINSEIIDMNSVKVKDQKIQIVKRFYFNSDLKRMSVVANYKNKQYLFTKGGPEIVQQLLASVPQFYEQIVEEYVTRGLRVLALAYKEIDYTNQTRQEVECGLKFLGLLVCQTPLKLDTASAIQTLLASDHQLKVISGDHVLNVAVTAQQCGIIQKDQQIFVIQDFENNKYVCQDLQGKQTKYFSEQEVLESSFAFCLTNSNKMLKYCISNNNILQKTHVFARTTPQQKQQIITQLKSITDAKVGFVGDGCNDLNALQAADVGIALMEEQPEEILEQQEKLKIPYPSLMGPNNTLASYQQIGAEAQMRAQRKNTTYRQEFQIIMAEQQNYKRYLAFQKSKSKQGIMAMWSEALEQEEENDDIKMGDAAIAAQFTIKSGSLNGVLDIIRQGRCTLTTVQMNFKTTALQCLIGAYSMTAMTLSGVRQSDAQLIASSLLSMVILMNISKAKESKVISKVKPPKTITGPYLILSMFGQAIIHISSLWYAQSLGETERHTVGFGMKFQPTQVNTIVFYVRLFLDACVTLVNFPGRPHMQAITEHKPVVLGIIGYIIAMIALMFEMFPEFNDQLGLLSLSEPVRMKILGCCLFDFVGSYLIEEFCKKSF